MVYLWIVVSHFIILYKANNRRTVCANFKEIVSKRLILSAGYDKINLRKDLIVNE